MKPSTIALIVAAGTSTRFEGENPKPYTLLDGKPVLRHTLETLLMHRGIDAVRVVIRREHHPLYLQAIPGLANIIPPVIGGATRQESVRLGLNALTRLSPQYVLIHDAARPNVSQEIITELLEALKHKRAALPALHVSDTLRRVEKDGSACIDRTNIMAAQTPQAFEYAYITNLHNTHANISVTDDAALVEHAGDSVYFTQGSRTNIKITTNEDLYFMDTLIREQNDTRIGFGEDTHAFTDHLPDTPESRQGVRICGIKIPHEKRLKGHSDADVGLHAIVDAILGAIGGGDIGQYFPPEDPKWAGADSSRFLIHAYELVKELEGEIVNIDVTIIGESPRIGPHRHTMQNHIASLLKLDSSRINVKATTTERMGYLGRGEGLTAKAVVAVRMPRSAHAAKR